MVLRHPARGLPPTTIALELQARFMSEIMWRIPKRRAGEPAEILESGGLSRRAASRYITGQLITR